MISPNSIAQVLDAAHVEDVINDFVTLKKRGANLLGLCPFHNEKTPSFTVSPTKNLYKCFGCGKGGNAVSFIMEHENYSFPEAIRYLAQKYGIELEETVQSDEQKEKTQARESLFIINEYAKKFFQNQLLNTDEGKSVGLSYFSKRGISIQTIKEFNLGYSPQERKALITKAEELGYKSEFLEQLGLKSRSGLDFFRSRIIFPITNLSGKVVAFGGRTLSSDKKIPKYLNSLESEIYNKSKSLYGIFQAKNEIRRQDNCFLVEGYTDVLSLSQNGVKNVVASSGTALTAGQLKVIRRFCGNITFLYDGDQAGQKAALRGLSIALEEGLNVKIVPLNEDQDPDSLVQEIGSSAFTEYIKEKSQDFIISRAKQIKSDFQSLPIEKAQAIKELIDIIAHILEPIKRSIYVKEVASILDLNEESLISELNKNIRKKLNSKQREQQQYKNQVTDESNLIVEKKAPSQSPKQLVFSDYYQEKDLIRILMKGGDQFLKKHETTVADFLIQNIKDVIDTFENDIFKEILHDSRDNLLSGQPPYTLDYYLNHDHEAVRTLALEFAQSPFEYANWVKRGVELQTQKMPFENYEDDSEKALYRFLLKKIQDKIELIEKEIKKENMSAEKLRILLTAKGKLDNSRREIASSQGNIVL